MVESVGALVLVIAVLSAAVDIGNKAYDYAEPKVKQGVEYIQEKIE